MSTDPKPARPSDNAFLGSLKGGSHEAAYAGRSVVHATALQP